MNSTKQLVCVYSFNILKSVIFLCFTGQGCFGSLDIKLSRVNNITVVVRQFNLEAMQLDQLLELQVW